MNIYADTSIFAERCGRNTLGIGKGGAAYFDLFCATGRARIKDTEEWIEGSAVAAWNMSLFGGAPFSAIYVSDIDLRKVWMPA